MKYIQVIGNNNIQHFLIFHHFRFNVSNKTHDLSQTDTHYCLAYFSYDNTILQSIQLLNLGLNFPSSFISPIPIHTLYNIELLPEYFSLIP